MPKYSLHINGKRFELETDLDKPLLWVLREDLKLTGSKFGCGFGICGACTVHLEGEPVRSCVMQVREAIGKRVKTIEGLSTHGDHPLQQAWIAEDVSQCGYCQSGQIMQAAALLARKPVPTDRDIDEAMKENLCRCGTYMRIRKAIHHAARKG